jgi:hypothetical protein
MAEFTKETSKQTRVLDFIKKNQPVAQSDIARHFMRYFKYANIQSAKVSIGHILVRLERQGKVNKKNESNESKGSISKNMWTYNRA